MSGPDQSHQAPPDADLFCDAQRQHRAVHSWLSSASDCCSLRQALSNLPECPFPPLAICADLGAAASLHQLVFALTLQTSARRHMAMD